MYNVIQWEPCQYHAIDKWIDTPLPEHHRFFCGINDTPFWMRWLFLWDFSYRFKQLLSFFWQVTQGRVIEDTGQHKALTSMPPFSSEGTAQPTIHWIENISAVMLFFSDPSAVFPSNHRYNYLKYINIKYIFEFRHKSCWSVIFIRFPKEKPVTVRWVNGEGKRLTAGIKN